MKQRLLVSLVGIALSASALGQGSAPARTAKVGDVAVYHIRALADRTEYDETVTVRTVDEQGISASHRRNTNPPMESIARYDPAWNSIVTATGLRNNPATGTLKLGMKPGDSWKARWSNSATNGSTSALDAEVKVGDAEETVKTAAGEFSTLKLSAVGYVQGVNWQGRFRYEQALWFAPSIGRVVKFSYKELRSGGADTVGELTSFKPAD
jgi:hypothetical protein